MIEKPENIMHTDTGGNNQLSNSISELTSLPNLILIAGNGRNVGKTFLACSIISYLSKSFELTGIKISSHFHPIPDNSPIISKTDNYIITEETSISRKDSSLMLQSGAKKVYFIMANEKGLKQAFEFIRKDILNHPVVCESGGLNQYVRPGLFLFVTQNKKDIAKEKYLDYDPVIINNESNKMDFNLDSIAYADNKIFLK